jgi:hypothetical protein
VPIAEIVTFSPFLSFDMKLSLAPKQVVVVNEAARSSVIFEK